MNPLRWSYRVSFFAGFLICAALLGFAFYAQYVLNMSPCPLCWFQRAGFVVMAIAFLLGAIHGPRAGGRWIYTGLALVGGVFGMAMAVRHLWVQSLPVDQLPDCGASMDYMLSTFPIVKVFKIAYTGSRDCHDVQPVLGLPIPVWTLIWFTLLSIWAIRATLRRAAPRLRL
ncbi:disulfide bond formation protein B [Dyella sp. 2HG41-7]|uniref:disulfide bond formation protein B n=1 Tax=Dyella sp. 2HG41-7 TaxID=2883239 RepID=UPI001F2D65E5|nr:disulfide bond formation protein B [Dyella sp. 2HG41-7]